MYSFGQVLNDTAHFQDHMSCGIPVQVYNNHLHADIGLIRSITLEYIKINEVYYHRSLFTFISRPGY